jgi:hypothetical protein
MRLCYAQQKLLGLLVLVAWQLTAERMVVRHLLVTFTSRT